MRAPRILAGRHGRAEPHRASGHRRHPRGDRAGRDRALRRLGRRCWPSRSPRWRWPGLAHVVSLATEQVGERFGPAATGVLQSTLGNLPELFVVIFALRAGEVVVAQTSIIGSILANALLVLGLVIVVGARQAPDGVMRFRPRLPNDTATLLLVASFIIVIVGVAHATHEPAARHEREISTDRRHRAARGLPGVGGPLRARRGRGERAHEMPPRGLAGASRSRCSRSAGVGCRLRLGLVHRRAAPDDRPARRRPRPSPAS